MAIAITNEEAAAPTTNDADLGEQQPTAVNSVVSAMGHHRVFAVNSRTWQPSMHVPLKLIHDHEKDIEQSCLDGDYARFMELANVKWGYRLRGTNDTQTQQLLFRDDEAPDFQYSLDLVTPPDCKRLLHSHNGSITEFDEKSFLHLAVQGENVEIVAHLADLCGGVTGAMNRQDTLGRTPFQLACKYGKLDFVDVLWNRRRTGDRLLLNTTDTDGQSPFHAACQSGCVPLVIWLYEHGAEIEAPAVVRQFSVAPSETEEAEQWAPQYTVDFRSSSPLVCATIYRHMDIVKLLLGWGANRNTTAEVVGDAPSDNAKFFDKKKPVEIAKCQGLDELAMLFNDDGPTRLRRTTPIKERAEKANVLLPPTPGGIRSGISDGSPSTVRESKKRLHKHQKACHKKVALAETTADAFAPRC